MNQPEEPTSLEQIFENEFGSEPTLSPAAQAELEEYRHSDEAMHRRLRRLLLFYESSTLRDEARERLLAEEMVKVMAHLEDVDEVTQQRVIGKLRRLGLVAVASDNE